MQLQVHGCEGKWLIFLFTSIQVHAHWPLPCYSSQTISGSSLQRHTAFSYNSSQTNCNLSLLSISILSTGGSSIYSLKQGGLGLLTDINATFTTKLPIPWPTNPVAKLKSNENLTSTQWICYNQGYHTTTRPINYKLELFKVKPRLNQHAFINQPFLGWLHCGRDTVELEWTT